MTCRIINKINLNLNPSRGARSRTLDTEKKRLRINNAEIEMAKIKPMALIESMSKKVCEHSDVYFRTNKKTGKVYTGKLCNPSTKEPSAAQTAAKARFAKVSAAVRTILAGSSEQKTQLVAEYNAQNKIGSLFGYAMKKLNDQYDQNGDPIGG